MHKPIRPRRARPRQVSSQIPLRTSSSEQTQKSTYCVHADGSGGDNVITSSNNEEIEKMMCTPRCDSVNGTSRKTIYQISAESDGDGICTMGNPNNQEREKILCSSRHMSGNGEYQKTVYQVRAESDGDGVYSKENSNNEESIIYTSRSDDGEITTVRQTFKIVGTIDQDNRCSKESLNSNVDSAFHGSQDVLYRQQYNESSYAEEKMMKTVSFEDVGSNNVGKLWIKPTDNIKSELEQEVGEDEELLREELLRIFDRERLTLGSFFKNKMEDMARDCRQRELSMEEHSRAEITEMESEMVREKAEMQKVFAEEIAALTRTFNEDRANMESYHKEQIKELREQQAEDQKDMDQKLAREKAELQEKLESEFQAVLKAELSESQQSSWQEIAEREEKFNIDKLEMEKRHNIELHEAEMNTKKVKDELEMMFSQEKSRLEERIKELEKQLWEEREMRINLESLLEEEKENVKSVDSAKRNETEKLKSELEGLRVELDEKSKAAMEMGKFEEEIRTNGKSGLSGKLREDFDKIIDEHKQELERKYLMHKEELQKDKERQLQDEKKRIQDDVEVERKKMKEEIDKERQEIQISLKKSQSGEIKHNEDFTSRSTARSEYKAGNPSYKDEEKYRQYEDEHAQREMKQCNEYNGDRRYTNGNERSPYGEQKEPERRKTHYNPTYDRDENTYSLSINPEQVPEQYQTRYDTFDFPNDTQPSSANQELYPGLRQDGHERHEHYGGKNKRHYQQPEGRHYQYGNGEKYPTQDQPRERPSTLLENTKYQSDSQNFQEPIRREHYDPVSHSHHPNDSSRRFDSEDEGSHSIGETGETSRYPTGDQHKSTRDNVKPDQFYVTPGNENDLRSEINLLRSENEGLKAKVGAMEENIDLHKKYKSEAKDELNRLQKTKEELQSKLEKGSENQDDARRAKIKADKLEKSLRESEARRKEFEAKITELNFKLSNAENKAHQAKDKTNDLEYKIREHGKNNGDRKDKADKRRSYGGKDEYPRDLPNDEITALESSPVYQEDVSIDTYGRPDIYASKDTKHENVYGYPAELSQSLDFLDCKNPDETTARDSHQTKYEYDPAKHSWKNPDSKKGKYTKSPHSSKNKSTSRPGVSSVSSPYPIYGSHDRLGRSSDKTDKSGYEPGRYSSFGSGNDPGFNTSSPRKLDGHSYRNDGGSVANDCSSANKENYEKTVAERDKLVRLIKELKLKVEELHAEKERVDKEESKIRRDPVGYKFSENDLSSSEHADLKTKVEDMQKKIRVLAERLKRDSPRGKHSSFDHNDNYTSKPSMHDIEYLQDKLQRTDNAISHTHDNSDPDVLLRIENEVKAIGELIKKHCNDYEQGGSTYRSDSDNVRMLQLQMEKQELEMKLNMAKDAMKDYVSRLSDKMEGLEESNALSDATLQELYERNAKLKQTLKALEKGQQRSQRQNEELRHQSSALQNVIGQICKSEDTSFCSQYSTPRQTGGYGYTMTSQSHSKGQEMGISDRFRSY